MALGVVLAAHGYPMNPRKGDVIKGLPKGDSSVGDDAVVFHAGTTAESNQTLTSGGRVLCVTALADSVKQAQGRVYEVISAIGFEGMQFRRDIGYRAVK